MRIKITKPGIFGGDGKEIAVGTELTVKSEPKGWEGRFETISGSSDVKTAATGEGGGDKPAFEAKHKGRGNYSIFNAAGEEVKQGLTKDEVEKFEALSAEEQAAFVAQVDA